MCCFNSDAQQRLLQVHGLVAVDMTDPLIQASIIHVHRPRGGKAGRRHAVFGAVHNHTIDPPAESGLVGSPRQKLHEPDEKNRYSDTTPTLELAMLTVSLAAEQRAPT